LYKHGKLSKRGVVRFTRLTYKFGGPCSIFGTGTSNFVYILIMPSNLLHMMEYPKRGRVHRVQGWSRDPCGLGWALGLCTRGGPDPHWKGTVLMGMMSGFSRMLPATIPSGPDVGISQHSDWLAAEAVECHIKFS